MSTERKIPSPSGEVRATTVSAAVDPCEGMATPAAGDASGSQHRRPTKTIAEITVGPSTWTVESHCGVVRVISSRDGCMFAINSGQARGLAHDLGSALRRAANSVDRASAGGAR